MNIRKTICLAMLTVLIISAAGCGSTVVGVFGTYQEGEYTYCTLTDASLA